jgi:hypothetical protein
MRCARIGILIFSLAPLVGCEDPIAAEGPGLEALRISAELRGFPDYRAIYAGESAELVVIVVNDTTETIRLGSPQACIVSFFEVLKDEFEGPPQPAHFSGTGEQTCAPDEVLVVPPSDTIEIRIPFVAWVEPEGHTAFVDGPPWPWNYRAVVTSEPLNQRIELPFSVAPSGWHTRYGRICPPAPATTDSVAIVVQPSLIADVYIRLRFTVHNIDLPRFWLDTCSWAVISVIDRRTPEGWTSDEPTRFCTGDAPSFEFLDSGECLRSGRLTAYEPGEYRLRIWTNLGVLTTESVVIQ